MKGNVCLLRPSTLFTLVLRGIKQTLSRGEDLLQVQQQAEAEVQDRKKIPQDAGQPESMSRLRLPVLPRLGFQC